MLFDWRARTDSSHLSDDRQGYSQPLYHRISSRSHQRQSGHPQDPRGGQFAGGQEIDCANTHGVSAARTGVAAVTVRLVLRRNLGAMPLLFAQCFFLITGLLAMGYTAFHVAARYVYEAYEYRVFDHAVALHRDPPRATATARSLVGK